MSKQTPPDGNTGRQRRVPLDAQVELKFENFRGFLDEIAANLSEGGMFVKGTNPPPVGTVVQFALKLQDDYSLIQGTGEVAWVRAEDAGEDAPAGVGIRFLKLKEPSGELIRKIVERYENDGGETFDLQRSEPIAPSTPEARLGPGSSMDLAAALAAEAAKTVSAPETSELPIPGKTTPDPFTRPDPDLDSAVLHIDELPKEAERSLAATIFTPPDPAPVATVPAEEPLDPEVLSEEREPPPPVAQPAAPSPRPTPGVIGDKPPPPQERGLGRGGRPSFLLFFLLIVAAFLGAAGYRFTEMLVEWGTGYASEAEEASRVQDIPPPQSLQAPAPQPVALPAQPDFEEQVDAPGADGEPTAVAAEPPPPSPALPPLSQVRLITWKDAEGGGTHITLRGNGRFNPENLTRARLPNRLVLKLRGIDWPLRAPVLVAETPEVRRIRTGWHPKPTGNELHIVFDLVDDEVQLEPVQISDTDVHLFLRR